MVAQSFTRSPTRGAVLLAAFLLLAALLNACSNKKNNRPPATKAAAAAAQAARSIEGLLGMIPADAEVVGVVLDWKRAYSLVESLRRGLDHDAFGKMILIQLRALPVPWSEKELSAFGLDPKGPWAIFGKQKPVLLFSVRDGATLKKSLAQAWTRGQGTWKTVKDGNSQLHILGGPRPVYCLFVDKRMLCSSDRPTLLKAHAERPKRSFWASLSADERRAAKDATVIFSSSGQQAAGVGMLKVEPDGATIRLRLTGPALSKVAAALGSKGAATLPGLTGDAATAIYLRADLGALLSQGKELMPALQPLGLDAITLQASLTGELLVLERSPAEMALVLGCRDPRISQKLVDGLARMLKGIKPAKGGAKIKVTAHEAGKGAASYKVVLPPSPKGPANGAVLGLAAGPAGVYFGAWTTVQELAAKPLPDVAKWRKGLASEAEREVFADKAMLAVRSPVGDPLGPMTDVIDQLLKTGNVPPQVQQGVRLGRFFLEQLHSHTIGVVGEGQDRVRLVWRLRTLHRDGQADDDKARTIWLAGLASKYAGKRPAYEEALKRLAKEHPKTRYGGLLERRKPGLLASVFTGAVAAMVVPAFTKYQRSSQRLEAHEKLSKIALGAKISFLADRFSKGGKLMPKRFPATVGWTPAAPCCKTGGSCAPDAGSWATPTWQALRFSLASAHRFQYRFTNHKDRFLAEARGDLNCNGKYSRYTIEGKVDKDGTVTLAPLKTKDPLE